MSKKNKIRSTIKETNVNVFWENTLKEELPGYPVKTIRSYTRAESFFREDDTEITEARTFTIVVEWKSGIAQEIRVNRLRDRNTNRGLRGFLIKKLVGAARTKMTVRQNTTGTQQRRSTAATLNRGTTPADTRNPDQLTATFTARNTIPFGKGRVKKLHVDCYT